MSDAQQNNRGCPLMNMDCKPNCAWRVPWDDSPDSSESCAVAMLAWIMKDVTDEIGAINTCEICNNES